MFMKTLKNLINKMFFNKKDEEVKPTELSNDKIIEKVNSPESLISDQTILFIKKWEGCKLKAYQCSAKTWTIGYGTTVYSNGEKVKEGDIISQEQADKELSFYLENNCKLPDIDLTEDQKTAIYSLQYNIGLGAWNKSTLKKLILENSSETEIKQAWLSWNKITVNGKKVQDNSLSKRRQSEVDLYFNN